MRARRAMEIVPAMIKGCHYSSGERETASAKRCAGPSLGAGDAGLR
jgi:hypothetical protein